MNSVRPALRLLAVLCIPVVSGTASAGEVAPISRETVSISVTVPPHITFREAPASLDASSAAPTLCVGTNGFSQYHLAMIRHPGRAEDEEILGNGGGRLDASICPGAIPIVPQMLAGLEPSSAGAVTLLIIPD